MRDRLINLLGAVQGDDKVCLIKSETLREILQELQAMCQPLDPNDPSIIVTARTPRAGFDLSVAPGASGLGTVDSPYTMLGDALSPSALQVDTWDVESPPGGTQGVIWKGPRIYLEAATTPDTTTDSPSGDTTDWDIVTAILASRQLTFDDAGNLRTISAEIEMGSFGFR